MCVALAGTALFLVAGSGTHRGSEIPSWPMSNALTQAPAAGHAARASITLRFRAGVTARQQRALLARYGAVETGTVSQLQLHVVSVASSKAKAVLHSLQHAHAIEAATPDDVRQIAGGISSGAISSQWAFQKIGWPAAVTNAKAKRSVTLAVLDTGVDATRPDLAHRLIGGYSAFAGASARRDPNGHGTWMTSIALAVDPSARVMPVQVLNGAGYGEDSDIIKGLVWAADHGANVILMSFTGAAYSPDLQRAIDYAWSKGAVVVAATGNSGSSSPTYPAGDAKVVGVSATDPVDHLWSGSNYGVDTFLAAPGVDITADAVGGGTTSVTGTSASAALVAGGAALLLGADPKATNASVIGKLAASAHKAGTRAQTGNGRLDLARALATSTAKRLTPAGVVGRQAGGPFAGPYTIASSAGGMTVVGSGVCANAGGVCTGTSNQLVITLTAAVPVGSTLFVVVGRNMNSGSTISAADNLGTHNTFTNDAQTSSGTAPVKTVAIIRSSVTHALAVGNTITVTVGSNDTTLKSATVFYFTGVVSATPLDQASNGTNKGTTTPATAATTATTTQGAELVIGGVTNATPGAANNSCTATTLAGVAGTMQVEPLFKYVSTTGIQTCGAAVAASTWVAAVATYKVSLTNPTQSVSVTPLTGTNLQYWNSGTSTLYYNPTGAGGTFTIGDSPADAGTDLLGDTFPGLSGTSAEVLVDNPVSYWRLGETAGTVATDAKGVQNGTYTGGYTLNQTGALSGDPNKSILLNGTNGYVNVGNPAALQLTSGTLEAWFKTSDNSAAYHNILQKQNAYAIMMNTGILGEYDPGSNSFLSTGINVADGQWHLVDVTFTSGTANGTKFYLDGRLVLTTTYTQANQTGNLQIGANGAATEFWNGSIDDVAIYGTQLSQARILTHYLSAATVPPAPTGFSGSGTTITAFPGSSLTHTFGATNTTAPSSEVVTAMDAAGNIATTAVNFFRDVLGPTHTISVTSVTGTNLQYWNSGTSTLYYNPTGAGGTFTVTDTPVDAGAGVASDTFPGVNGTADEIMANSPVLYWRFSETSGTAVADTSGTGNGGTFNGTYTRNVTPGALSGDSDPASTLTATGSSYVIKASPTSIPSGASNRSVEVWFKTTTTTKQALTDYGGGANAQEFGLFIATSTSLYTWGFGTGEDLTFNTPYSITDGAWHQAVETYDGGTNTMTVYLDGASLGSQSPTTTLNTAAPGAQGFNVGVGVPTSDGTNGGKYFNGQIDEVAVFPSVLSPATVLTHYAARTHAPAPAGFTASSLTDGGAPWQSATHTFTNANTTAPGTETVTGVDNVGNTGSATALTFVRDVTAPTGGALSIGPFSSSLTVSPNVTALYAEAMSGTASGLKSPGGNALTRAQAAPSSPGVCPASGYASPATINANITATGVISDTVPTSGVCYQYTLTGTDNVSNTATVTATVLVDTVAPTGSLTAPAAAANLRGTTVAVSSDSADAASGVASALFQRSPTGAGTWTTIGAADTTSPYSVTWDTTAVTDGQYDLRVITTDNAGNTFTSALITVRVDNTAPTNTLTLASITGGAYLTGTTVYYRGAALGNFQLTNTVTDTGSGPANSIFPTLGGTTTNWTHTTQTVTTPAGGPYTTTNNFAWTAGATSAPTESITSTDNAGNTSTATLLTFTNDSTAPTGTLTAPTAAANLRGTTVAVSSDSADAASGVASALFQRSPTGAGTWTTIGAADTTSPYSVTWDTTAVTDGQYDLRVITTDNVGNTFTSALITVRVDNTAPTNTLTLASITGGAYLTGTTVYYRGAALGNFQLTNTVTDTGSGPANSIFPTLGGTTTNWTHTTQTVTTPAGGPYTTTNNFAWTAGATSAPTESITSTDNAGNTSTATLLTFTNDSTAPTGTLTAPTAAANLRGTTVAVSSDSADAASGVASALFQRSPTGAGTWTTIGAADTTSPYSVTWDTTAVTDGQYDLRVITTDNVGNTFTSALITVRVDNTAPTNTLTLASITGGAYLTGTTVYYRGAALGNFQLTNTVTDTGSGPANSIFPTLGGTTTNWTHTTQTVTTPAGGPYTTTNNFAWTAGATSAPTESITSTDNAGNTSTATLLTFTNDSTAPTGGALTVNGQTATSGGTSGYNTTGNYTIGTRTDYGDAGSGLASSTLTIATATLSGNTCGSYGSTTPIVGSPAQTEPTGCYLYTLTGTDNVGNTTTITTAVIVDTTAPSAPTLTPANATGGAYYSGSGTTVYFNPAAATGSFDLTANSTDPDTGITGYTFPTAPAQMGTNWTVAGAGATRTYTYTTGAATPGSQTVTATNNAGNTNTTNWTTQADSTAPTGGALTVNGQTATSGGTSGYNTTGNYTIGTRTDYGDAGSGLASSTLTIATATLSGNTCGSYGSTTPIVGSPAQTEPTGCYLYTLTGTDNVGNTTTITTAVIVDTTAPSAPTLTPANATGGAYYSGSGTTVYFNPAAATGSFDLTANSTDPDTGITGYTFPTAPAQMGTNWTVAGAGATRTYTYTTGAATPGSQTVTATNNAGNTNTTNWTTQADSTAPTGGALTVNGQTATSGGTSGYNTTGNYTIGTRTDYGDAGSGLASSTLTIATATLSGNTCGSYGSTTPIVGSPAQTEPTGCYLYTLTGTDNVGNTTTITTAVIVDTTAPSAPTLTPANATGGAYYSGSGTTVYFNPAAATGSFDLTANSTDPDTGITGYTFPTAPAQMGTNWTVAGAGATRTYTYTTGAATPGSQTVTATNNAGNTNTTNWTTQADSTAPTGGALTVNGQTATSGGTSGYNTTGNYTIGTRTDYGDAGSGLASSTLTIATATLSGNTCGSYGSTTPIVGSPAQTEPTGCYLYTLTGTDNVGNTTTITTAVIVDTTAPSAPTGFTFSSITNAYWPGSGATVYFQGGIAGGFTVTGTGAADADTGITGYTYPTLGGSGWSNTAGVYTFTSAATTHSGPVTAQNNAGLTSSGTTFTAQSDTTAPTGGGLSIGGFSSSLSVSPNVTALYAETQTGTASGLLAPGGNTLTRTQGAPTAPGSCAGTTFGSPATISANITATGTIADTVPLDGQCYQYTLTGTDNVGNTATTTATTLVDTTAPSTPSLSFGSFSNAYASGTTVYFKGSAAGGFTVTPSSSDAESGVAGYTYPGLGGGAWSHTNGVYTFTSAATTQTGPVTATNGSGLTSTGTNFTAQIDSTAPSGGTISAPAYSSTLDSITITTTPYGDAGSGIASNVITRSDAQTPSSPGVCPVGGYTGSTVVTSPDTVPTDGRCYVYTLTGTDNVNNSATIASSPILVDTTAPSAPTLAFSAFTNAYAAGTTVYFKGSAAGGFTVTPSSSDAESGIASYAYPGLGGGAWSHTNGAYTFTSAATTQTGSVTATNNAGTTGAGTSFTAQIDSTAPTGGAISVPAFSNTLDSITITTTPYTDAGSGIASNVITRSNAQAPSSPGTCPATGYTGATTVTSPDTAPTDGQCYQYTLTGTDNVNNTSSLTSSPILIDTTAPSTPTVSFSGLSAGNTYDNGAGTLFFRPSAGGTFTVTAASNDNQSGIAGYTFGNLNTNGGTNFGVTQTSDHIAVTFDATTTGPTTNRTVHSTNGAGTDSTTADYTITQDSTDPSGGAISVPAFSNTLDSITITTTPYTDAGSGIASNVITRSNAQAPSSPGTCPATGYTGATTVTSPDTAPTDGQCYQYTLTGTDNVNNTSSLTSSPILIDTTAPSTPTVSFSGLSAGNTYDNGAGTLFFRPSAGGTFTVTAASNDNQSGIAGYTFGNLNTNGGTNFGVTQTSDHIAVTFDATTTGPTTNRTVHSTNGAGTDSTTADYTITQDSTAPSGGAISVPAFSNTLDSITITTTPYTDAGSGIASNVITRSNAQAPSSPGTCPATGYTGATTVTSPDTAPTDGQCYQYTLTGTDNVNNTSSLTSSPILIDTTAPSAPSLSFGSFTNAYASGTTVYFKGNAAGGFTVTPTSTDNQSGIAGYTFPGLGGGAWTHTNGAYTFTSAATTQTGPITATNNTGTHQHRHKLHRPDRLHRTQRRRDLGARLLQHPRLDHHHHHPLHRRRFRDRLQHDHPLERAGALEPRHLPRHRLHRHHHRHQPRHRPHRRPVLPVHPHRHRQRQQHELPHLQPDPHRHHRPLGAKPVLRQLHQRLRIGHHRLLQGQRRRRLHRHPHLHRQRVRCRRLHLPRPRRRRLDTHKRRLHLHLAPPPPKPAPSPPQTTPAPPAPAQASPPRSTPPHPPAAPSPSAASPAR